MNGSSNKKRRRYTNPVDTRLKGRDFITLRDYTKEDLETILQVAFDLKNKVARGEPHPLLAGKSLGMLFCAPSTRTRISFETAMSQLGGHAQYYAPEHLQVSGLGETWADMARVISRYLDGLVVRAMSNPQIPALRYLKWGEAHAIVKTLADNASIPVINAADDMEHPCQMMADIMTIIEKFGPDYKRKKVAFVWAYKSKRVRPGVTHSLLIAGGTLGMRLTFAYPEGFELDPEYIKDGIRLAEQSGGSIEITHNINEAVKDADVIYAKAWGAMRKTVEEDARLRKSFRDWCIRKEHFDHAATGAIFMNPMPLERGEEATSEVVDGPMSVILDEAENRLHIQKAILSLIM